MYRVSHGKVIFSRWLQNTYYSDETRIHSAFISQLKLSWASHRARARAMSMPLELHLRLWSKSYAGPPQSWKTLPTSPPPAGTVISRSTNVCNVFLGYGFCRGEMIQNNLRVKKTNLITILIVISYLRNSIIFMSIFSSLPRQAFMICKQKQNVYFYREKEWKHSMLLFK